MGEWGAGERGVATRLYARKANRMALIRGARDQNATFTAAMLEQRSPVSLALPHPW